MALDMRERLYDNLRVRKHGQQRRLRLERLPDGFTAEDITSEGNYNYDW